MSIRGFVTNNSITRYVIIYYLIKRLLLPFKSNSLPVKVIDKFLYLALIIISFTQVVYAQEIIPCRCTSGQFDGKMGYVNQDDEIVTPLKYSGTLDPLEGYGRVTNKHQWGLIDSTGAMVVPIEFSDVRPFVNGDIARVSNLNRFNKVPNHWALYSLSKQDTITGYDYQEVNIYSKTSLFVYSKVVDGQRVRGILNKEGKELYQTEKGEYLHANRSHSSGVFVHEVNGQQTFVDSTGRELFKNIPRGTCTNFYEGRAFICNSNGCFNIDIDGTLTAVNFDGISEHNINGSPLGGYTIIVKDGMKGVAKYTGDLIVIAEYEQIFFCQMEGAFIAINGGQSVLIDSTGLKVSDEYDRISYAQNGYFSVEKDGKHGLIDRSGKVIVEVKYDDTWHGLEVGACGVKLNDKWGIIDFENNILLPIENYRVEVRDNYIKYRKIQYGGPQQYVYVYKTSSGEVKLRKLDKHNAKPCVFK